MYFFSYFSGLMPFTVPFVKYEYSEFYPEMKNQKKENDASSWQYKTLNLGT